MSPDCADCRAAANLRSALCQGRRLGAAPAIDSADHCLRLAPSHSVDFHEAWDAARCLACAVKRYQDYRRLLQLELKVAPSPRLTRLVRDLTRT